MNYKKNNVVIVTIVSLLFILSSAIVYFVFFVDKTTNDNAKDSIYVKVTDKDIIDELKEVIISNNLIELARYEKNIDNINTMNNSQKLNMAFNKIINDKKYNYDEKIDANQLEEYFKNNFKDMIYYNNENILCSCKEKLYIYDKKTNTYEYNIEHSEHLIYKTDPYYIKVLSVDKKNDTYIIKVTYVWSTYNIDGYTNVGYASYNDSLNRQNKLFEIEVPDISVNYNPPIDSTIEINKDMYAIKEIETNYELYKNKLHKYTYTFIRENDIYKLLSFKFEK